MSTCVFKAQLLNMRTDLCEVQASKAVLESEVHRQLLNVHSAQLELATVQRGSQQSPDSQEIMRRLVRTNHQLVSLSCLMFAVVEGERDG